MDHLKRYLEKRPHFASILFFVEAFTPLPSDQLFIAYGLTGFKLRYAIVPFFVARIFTYSFWAYTANGISKEILANSFAHLTFISWSFVIGEILLMFLIYYFVKIDWEYLISHRKFRTLR